ncbi:hypothetical protein L211DRAFT_295492 [Terfezia boudieri ATCC MYA-4762]|uniref:DEAD/DEAH box helicase domain-containing protein n=1 Tax=Terfezia boudieri ATCC MYA-4762 TaxID=1051890 RepID=A0A3N4LJY4_9PEZI|nr:hypothetical protein L211DRAFT_295492 [Terfezia boudieri ATCC MYA-4762]
MSMAHSRGKVKTETFGLADIGLTSSISPSSRRKFGENEGGGVRLGISGDVGTGRAKKRVKPLATVSRESFTPGDAGLETEAGMGWGIGGSASTSVRPSRELIEVVGKPSSAKQGVDSGSLSTAPVTIKTRAYQQEMFEESLKKNIIVCQGTGSGKTHVSLIAVACYIITNSYIGKAYFNTIKKFLLRHVFLPYLSRIS